MKSVLFSIFAITTAFTYWLRHINLAHLKKNGSVVPAGFDGLVTTETLEKSSAYTFESSRLGLWGSLFDNILLLLFLFAGFISLYDRFILSLTGSFILQGVLFFSCSPGGRRFWKCRSRFTVLSLSRRVTVSTRRLRGSG